MNERYENWISGYKEGNLLIVHNDNMDFKNNPEDLGTVIEMIERETNSLFTGS